MKRILITALISLVAVGTASADFASDVQNDSLYASTESTTVDINSLPATAAGRTTEVKEQGNFGGMQDHPSERVSGI